MARKSRSGRSEPSEHWTKCLRTTMETPAWRAISPTAQALYVWIKLEWKGPEANINGKIRLSTRQAAEKMGITQRPILTAFHELQAKGFLHQTESACLGTEGAARGPAFEITEIALPGHHVGRKLYGKWTEGNDYPVPRPVQPARRNAEPR